MTTFLHSLRVHRITRCTLFATTMRYIIYQFASTVIAYWSYFLQMRASDYSLHTCLSLIVFLVYPASLASCPIHRSRRHEIVSCLTDRRISSFGQSGPLFTERSPSPFSLLDCLGVWDCLKYRLSSNGPRTHSLKANISHHLTVVALLRNIHCKRITHRQTLMNSIPRPTWGPFTC